MPLPTPYLLGQKRSLAARLTPFVLAAFALVFAGSLGLACDPAEDLGECVGGIIIDGVCEGKCSPEKCKEQNTCVDNRCLLVCASHGECQVDGVQSCAPAKEDDTGADILVCQASGKPLGLGASCLSTSGCEDLLACPDGGGCSAAQCDGDPAACARDEAACEGASGCTAGKCPGGDTCRVGCETDCSPWLSCEGVAEDPNAYCTLRDCASDDDCIAGFHCGVVRAPHDVCGPVCAGPEGEKKCAGGPLDGATCESDSACQKGNDSLCGQTAEPCKTPGQGSGSFFEGSVCLLRRSCLERGPGDVCQSDVDCSRNEGQKCVAAAGETRCAPACASDLECQSDASCDVAQGACVPRFGAWVGTGQFCEPCVNDEDCGSAGSSVACLQIQGGGRACFDQSHPDVCTTDDECPMSPGGLHGVCLDEGEGISPGNPLYDRCSFPVSAGTGKPTCW